MTRPDPHKPLKGSLEERLKVLAAIQRALREGTRAALLRHKALGQSIAVWRDGKVVIIPPEMIEVELDRESNGEVGGGGPDGIRKG